MFWAKTGRQLRKVWKWQDQADCSRREQRQPEKLGHRLIGDYWNRKCPPPPREHNFTKLLTVNVVYSRLFNIISVASGEPQPRPFNSAGWVSDDPGKCLLLCTDKLSVLVAVDSTLGSTNSMLYNHGRTYANRHWRTANVAWGSRCIISGISTHK